MAVRAGSALVLALACAAALPPTAAAATQADEILTGLASRHQHSWLQDDLSIEEMVEIADRGAPLRVSCGYVAEVGRRLLERHGIRSRVVQAITDLELDGFQDGHVLLEVWQDGRWELWDLSFNRRAVDAHGTPIGLVAQTWHVRRGTARWQAIAHDDPFDPRGLTPDQRRWEEELDVTAWTRRVMRIAGLPAQESGELAPIIMHRADPDDAVRLRAVYAGFRRATDRQWRDLVGPPWPAGEQRLAGGHLAGWPVTLDSAPWEEAETIETRWEVCDPSGGGCRPVTAAGAYTPGTTDVGRVVRVTVTARNEHGQRSVVLATPPIAGSWPDPAGPPRVTGAAAVGSTLRVVTAAAGAAIRWERCLGGACVPIPGATGAAYVVTMDDATHALRARVTADGATQATAPTPTVPDPTPPAGRFLAEPGTPPDEAPGPLAPVVEPEDERPVLEVAAEAPAPAPVSAAAPAPAAVARAGRLRLLRPVALRGVPRVGRVLQATPGQWSGRPTTVRYVWLRSGWPIRGATRSTYRLTERDIGETIAVRVTAAGAAGTGVTTSRGVRVREAVVRARR